MAREVVVPVVASEARAPGNIFICDRNRSNITGRLDHCDLQRYLGNILLNELLIVTDLSAVFHIYKIISIYSFIACFA